MTARIVNLNAARKAAARAKKRAEADANAAKHGRTRAARLREAAQSESAARHLDGHRLDTPPGDAPGRGAPPD